MRTDGRLGQASPHFVWKIFNECRRCRRRLARAREVRPGVNSDSSVVLRTPGPGHVGARESNAVTNGRCNAVTGPPDAPGRGSLLGLDLGPRAVVVGVVMEVVPTRSTFPETTTIQFSDASLEFRRPRAKRDKPI